MDLDSDSNLNLNQTRLQRTLSRYSHLDLTSNVVPGVAVFRGGGGFSDVYLSTLEPSWKPRPDVNITSLLQQQAEIFETIPQLRFNTKLPSGSNYTRVAVKRLRFFGEPEAKIEKVFYHFVSSPFNQSSVQEIAKELRIWAELSHPHVLPILGYVLNWLESDYPSFISPWMENGTLRSYYRSGKPLDVLPIVSRTC